MMPLEAPVARRLWDISSGELSCLDLALGLVHIVYIAKLRLSVRALFCEHK